MRRTAIFAHHDPQNRIKGYILHHLAALREVCEDIHFASTSHLATEELRKLEGLVASQRTLENTGYDFGMWAAVISELNLRECDELVLSNSSICGPLMPLSQTFARMEHKDCDFWALTDSLEIEYHLQSFFLVMRRRLLESGNVERFFASILPYRHKRQVIRSYEVGLTHFFLDQGFLPAVLASVLDPELRIGARNASIWTPLELVDLGVPYVKVELLRENPAGVGLARVRQRMLSHGYSMDLLELDRPAPRRLLKGLFNRLLVLSRKQCILARPHRLLRPEIFGRKADAKALLLDDCR